MPVRSSRVDSALGRWITTTWEPAPGDALAPYVHAIWDFEGVLAQTRERVFPSGALELIVQLDEPHRPGDVPGAAHFPALCIGGLPTTSAVVEAPPARCRVLGVRMRPAAMFALTGVALDEIRDLTVDLRDVVGRDADVLGERCHGASTGEQRVRAAASWVASRVLRARHVDPRIAWAAATIDARGGAVAIADLEETVGRRRMRDGFRTHVGVSPKRLARIVRFRSALTMVAAGTPLTDVALRAGYYDQPHFAAEFRAHAGMTPTAFLAAKRYPQGTSVAEG